MVEGEVEVATVVAVEEDMHPHLHQHPNLRMVEADMVDLKEEGEEDTNRCSRNRCSQPTAIKSQQ